MYCRANWLLLAVVAGLGMAAMLNACGQKGPLYLPDTQKEADAGTALQSSTTTNDQTRPDD